MTIFRFISPGTKDSPPPPNAGKIVTRGKEEGGEREEIMGWIRRREGREGRGRSKGEREEGKREEGEREGGKIRLVGGGEKEKGGEG